MTDPIRPTDAEARALAQTMLSETSHAALAVLDSQTGNPMVTRIALHLTEHGVLTLLSDLSSHTAALRANPIASILIGEPGPKGDPLTYARLTLQATASFIDRAHPQHSALRACYLERQPKALLYVDFADFHFVHFMPVNALLNGGFGKAYRLTAADLVAT